MKKSSTWAGIMGGVLIAGSGYGLSQHLANPTNLFWVNLTITITNLAWIALGVFLVTLFVRWRQKEDVENEHIKPVSDSHEDVERLVSQRNWILGFVLALETIASIEPWLLNDYTSGFTILNIAVIFDLLVHIVFLYIIIQLFRGKKEVLQFLFYAAIIYAGGWLLFDLLRDHWVGAFISVVLGAYFIYAIKAPLSRRNHRIAHFVMLPAYIILLSAYPFFDNGNILELTKKESLAEQQFFNETDYLNGTYQVFLQREAPSKREIEDVRGAIVKREEKIGEIMLLVGQLEEEYKKQLPTVRQKKILEGFKYFLQIMETHRDQAGKLEDLMDYSEGVNFNALTDKQILAIRTLKDEIQSFNSKLTDIQFERNNANIDN